MSESTYHLGHPSARHPMNTNAAEILRRIENLEVKGAYLITAAALDCLVLRAQEVAEAAAPDPGRQLRQLARRLMAAQPSMACVANACAYVLVPLSPDVSAAEVARTTGVRAEAFRNRLDQAQQAVVAHGPGLIEPDDVVLMHSYSGTLLAIFTAAWEAGRHFQVIATESRPYSEGRFMAARLVERGIPCTLVTEAALADIATRASKAMVGADSLLATGGVVNKMGTHLLALACQARGVPLFAAASTLKFSTASLRGQAAGLLERPDDVAIVGPELGGKPGLRVVNRLFEVTPAHLFTGIITERGVVAPQAVAALYDKEFVLDSGFAGN